MSMGTPVILIVDDDEGNRSSLGRIFSREGFSVLYAVTGEEGLAQLRGNMVNVMVTDLKMPGMDGLELLRSARAISPEVEVILMTAYGTVETAVEAMKVGAYDFVTKPFRKAQIVKAVRQALEKQSLVLENKSLRAQLAHILGDREIIGTSPAMKRTLDLIRQAAPSTATVLLEGKSGTGKELLARTVHTISPRREHPFIAVNLAALPETIIESELFGYEKGAFTGATGRKEGRFSLADKGTLFLDEVAEIPPQMQVKLLRVLQEGEFERLGGVNTVKVDVRIVGATNKDLAEEVSAGRFRQDLYYRLNVINVKIPSLRERSEDIPLLATHFLRTFAEQNGKKVECFSPEAMDLLEGYHWPGNVRELQSVVERAVVLARQEVIGPDDLPATVTTGQMEVPAMVISLGTPLEEIEQKVIRETLRMTKGDKRLAARLLGIATRTIYRKVDKND